MSNSRSFNRTYDKRESREGMPLERFLERRKLDLNSWLQNNQIRSVADAEEKVKGLGICITQASYNQIVSYFETPIENENIELTTQHIEQKPQTKTEAKKKRTSEESPSTLS